MCKKLIVSIIIFCSMFLFFIGCATFKKADLDVLDNVALVSSFCNKEIDMSDFRGIGQAVSKLAQNKEFNLEPAAIQIKNDILEMYASHFPFKFIDEKTVTTNSAYKDLYGGGADWLKDAFYSTAAGYQVVRHTDREAIDKLFAAFPEADGLMFTNADFKLNKESSVLGFGTARVQAWHHMILINRDKKIIMNRVNYSVSRNTIKFALGGVFDARKIQPMCIEALRKASERTEAWVLKEMNK